MSETYISIDIEADGPAPGLSSMLSLGAAAFILDDTQPQGWRQLDTFQGVLQPLPEATPDPKTMAWWNTQPKAWKAATEGAVDPAQVMRRFVDWVSKFDQPVLTGYPVTYDFMWVYYYTIRFTGFLAPFGFQGLDIKTLAMERMSCDFKRATKRNMPRAWFKGAPKHTHEALDDAIGQGVLLMNLLTTERNNKIRRMQK